MARVLGDFFPRTSRPSGALAVKGVYCVRLSLKNVASQSSFSARKEIPQTLHANSLITVPYRRDFSIFLLRSTNQQPSALTFASLSAKNLKSHYTNIHMNE